MTIFINKILFFLTICTFFYISPLSAKDYCKLSNQVVKEYAKQFAKPRGLYLTGSGGAMMYDIEKVILNFLSFETLTVDEARILYVEMIEEFLCKMNQNEKIRPYLHNYPFSIENYKMRIIFEDSKRRITSGGHVALVLISRNQNLCFDAYDQNTEQFYELHEEPYEESRRIVQKLKQDLNSE